MRDGHASPLDPAIEEVVDYEARQVMREITDGVVQISDLRQWGRMGALEARERFDPRYGVHFKDFARHRIRGSMFDGLRGMGMLSRRTYERLRRAAIDEELVGDPTPEPAGGPTREQDAQIAFQAILELATSRLAAVACDPVTTPEEGYVRQDTIHKIRQAIDILSDDERRIVRAVYDLDDKGDSGAQLADRSGVSRSAISRRHRKILHRLRRLLKIK